MDTGILYIVATPIGNLADMTFRAVETLKRVDLVACEDTRVTKKLLSHYDIETPTISYFQHSKLAKVSQIMEILKRGQNVALVTDAGTPGVSDPGNKLVEQALVEQIIVMPIPGASAITALASVAGIDMQKFVFFGFPPHKKGRETFFREVKQHAENGLPVMFFESTHRILKALTSLEGQNVIVGKEITKMFEEIIRGRSEEILKYFSENPEKEKGEFVIIVHK